MQKFIGALSAVLLSSAMLTTAVPDARAGDKAHSCINPAGHERGSCKNRNRNSSSISGMVIAVNGDLVQFREDNGATISLNQSALLNSGMRLNVGGHYSLRGSWSDDMFVAESGAGYYGNNGYPYGGSVSVQGVITSINGNRLTLLQGLFSTVTVDDQQALNNGAAQDLYVGRSVTAYGFWNGAVFYATSIGVSI
jgi:hypothetical protein